MTDEDWNLVGKLSDDMDRLTIKRMVRANANEISLKRMIGIWIMIAVEVRTLRNKISDFGK